MEEATFKAATVDDSCCSCSCSCCCCRCCSFISAMVASRVRNVERSDLVVPCAFFNCSTTISRSFSIRNIAFSASVRWRCKSKALCSAAFLWSDNVCNDSERGGGTPNPPATSLGVPSIACPMVLVLVLPPLLSMLVVMVKLLTDQLPYPLRLTALTDMT